MANRTLATRITEFREAINAPIVHSLRLKAFKSSIARPRMELRSIKTYKQNGNKNGGGKANPKDLGTFDALKKMEIMTPRFIRLPENADKTDAIRHKEGFPYNNDNGKSYCTTSKTTYIEETTSGSPLIDDCLVIVKNIQGTSGS
ncbi:hypothetical protein N7471_008907 [Penicillium samsonianum]|uniref:uncharacterized protein n=1 Tax=Penicillium samsonianum TaxID=1882272 RepID=UPI002548263E|nr:uncharacterized protein N7471_008907 [Penicillium samsonianum]KAJ6127690.1 hypothetical protein N7471_008907 [Penicillium samsonianum]